MAFLEKNNVASYELYIQEELKKHRHGREKVIAHAVATIPTTMLRRFLQGPTAALDLQSCVIAATKQTFLIILTKQDFAEIPRVTQSFVFPLDKVELMDAKEGMFTNWLTLKINDQTTKLRLAKIIQWNDFAAFETVLLR